jgi:predicted TIM-barrel fold metal-dependent hydrolase
VKKIIDVRMRPPVGSFLKLKMFKDKNYAASLGKGFALAPSVLQDSLELLFEEMDSIGNYIGCVTGINQGADPASGGFGNKELYDLVSKYPDRFIGLGVVDIGDRRKALDDLDRCINEFGFKAINIVPGSYKVPMYADDRRLYPLYSKCADMGVPVFILVGGNSGLDISYSNPVHVEHVATDIPELKLVVNHGAWPWVTQILQVVRRRPNMYLSADIYLTFPGGDQYVDAVNVYLSDRFFYGTAYPFTPLGPYYEEFKSLGIKEEYMDKVLYKNLAELLKLG